MILYIQYIMLNLVINNMLIWYYMYYILIYYVHIDDNYIKIFITNL